MSIARKNEGRTNADATLLAILAAGSTIEFAATKAGVSESTVSRRLRNPKFRRALNRMNDAILSQTISRLSAACSRATDTLLLLLDCDSMPTRLGAAKAIIELSASLRTTQEFAERIRKLEERCNDESK